MAAYHVLLFMPIHLSPKGLSVLGIFTVNYQPLKWLAFISRLEVYLWQVAYVNYRSHFASISDIYVFTVCNSVLTTGLKVLIINTTSPF